MEIYKFWDYQTELDKEVTKSWYQTAKPWNCACSYCRNFMEVVRRGMLPDEVLNILNELEIPPENATYVCEIYPKEDKYCYQFSYRIVGNILSGDEMKTEPQAWGEGRCCHEPYPHGAPGFPAPHFDLEFWVELPWVLADDMLK